ncbi:MAG: crotonase/enoyl-CoA hydratase family protein [Rhizobiaceae bacterium]
MSIKTAIDGEVTIVTIDRMEARNAVDSAMADAMFRAFVAFDRDPSQKVAVLTGVDGAFCAGFDLKQASSNGIDQRWYAEHELDAGFDGSDDRPRKGPMGPTRLTLTKPVIAAISGAAVAGGMELALWCDMRVMERSAYMGVYCRRWGVPLIDGGTVRLPRIVGHGRAMDLILTGRKVEADECLAIGLANRVCDDGRSLVTALELARELCRFPQACMRADRMSAIRQWSLDIEPALGGEWATSAATFRSEGSAGAARFSSGKGRSGNFSDL